MRTTTVVIGGGHAGLAVSHFLAQRSIDHVVLERGEVANSWRTERWPSLRLLTPNWLSRLPGWTYQGAEPDGFMPKDEVIRYLERYAASFDAPVETGTSVESVRRTGAGYHVITDRGEWTAPVVVIATGDCQVPAIPDMARKLPPAIRQIAASLSCRVGGGVRTVDRARDILAAGARQVIAGSALFKDGRPDLAFARELSDAIGADRMIAAVDSRGGQVVIHGWKTALPITAVEAVQALEPFCGEFLYTHVDAEGLMGGTNLDAILAVRQATARRLTAAGGITTREEIDRLHAEGIDAVVGMAVYTGQLSLDAF